MQHTKNAHRPKVTKPDAPKADDGSALLSPKAFWTLVIIGIGFIAWLISIAPKQKRLACDTAPYPSLIEFGRCKEE